MAIPQYVPPCIVSRSQMITGEPERLAAAFLAIERAYKGPQEETNYLRALYMDAAGIQRVHVYIPFHEIIDCSTGRPWMPGPRKRPAQLAPYGVRPSDLPKPTQPARPRGWQEPIERLQPIKIKRQPESVPWSLGGMVEPAPDPELESVPLWLRELAEPESAPETEPAAVYRPMTGGVTRPPDKAPGEKKPKRKNMKRPKRAKANPWVAAIAAAFENVETKGGVQV